MEQDSGYFGCRADQCGGTAARPARLSELEIGQRAVICSLQASGSIRRRLIDLGFIEGTALRCILKGRRGESAAFLIRNTVIALRREDAAQIGVCPDLPADFSEDETVWQAASGDISGRSGDLR